MKALLVLAALAGPSCTFLFPQGQTTCRFMNVINIECVRQHDI